MLNSTVQMVLPPQPAARHLARHLLSRRRASGRLRGLAGQPRAHGQPRQLDRGRRDPGRGRIARGRGGARDRGRRLFRRRASPSGCSTRRRRSRGSGARGGGAAHDDPLRRGQPRRQRPAARASPGALLQGDPSKVTIEPLDDGRRARVTLDWHDPFRISEENDQITARVDIGVFANNGVHDSAPGDPQLGLPRARDPGLRTRAGRRPAHRLGRLRRPGEGEDLRRPAALPPRRLARRLRLRRGRHPARLDPDHDGRARDRLRPRRRPGARRRPPTAGAIPLHVAPVAYTLRPGPDGTLDVVETSADFGVGGPP